MQAIDDEILQELTAVAEARGCELLEVTFAGGVLRIVLDRLDGPVTVDDCADVSRQVSAFLDVMDFGASRYTLEVSSPGLDRPLRSARDYERFAGRLARLTVADEDGRRETVIARLEGLELDSGDGRLVIVDDETGERSAIELDRIEKARLEVEM